MAILKHIANKNADYSAALDYLKYEYDERSNKPLLDENGNMRLRSEFILEGINCCPETFDLECMQLNAQCHKNQAYDEIKLHHYIISFDPEDKTENGLTGEKAQAIGMEFAQKNFPGHQAIVCTHMDGHNGSGNIHVHIVINSLRKLDVERQDFMERPCDSRAGYKHHQTRNYLTHMQKSLMEICQRENLHQVDLLTRSKDKITDREYRARQRGQEILDGLNKEILDDGLTPMNTVFQTQKQYLRCAISDVAATATSEEMFCSCLQEKYGILLTEHRGRYSYLHPDRQKNITDRALGERYLRNSLLAVFEENAKAAEKENTLERTDAEKEGTLYRHSAEFDPDYNYEDDPIAILYIRSDLRLVADLQECTKDEISRAYERKVMISNLQMMAKTIAYVQEHGYDTRENLRTAYDKVNSQYQSAQQVLNTTKADLKSVNAQIHYTGQYLATKSVYGQFLNSRNKKKFRQDHSAEIESYEAAVKFLKALYPDEAFPSMKSLKTEKEHLAARQEEQQITYAYYRDYRNDLRTICSNVNSILGQGKTLEHGREDSRS